MHDGAKAYINGAYLKQIVLCLPHMSSIFIKISYKILDRTMYVDYALHPVISSYNITKELYVSELLLRSQHVSSASQEFPRIL
jgi:hypothetical protein